jgi:2-amino-4-hydroxy-6-hydroxymethyldihydropteridine diphosphokinase
MPYITKKLSENKAIIKNLDFPKSFSQECQNKVALIGVGGNIGDSKRRFKKLLIFLQREKKVKLLESSIIFKNPPFGFLEQDFFYNTLLLIDTKLPPKELLRYLQRVEKHFRRVRLFKDGPRTLDLDIIFYEKRKCNKSQKLLIPHPFWKERESVLIPLKFLKGKKCLQRVL